jgi:hypothetical protein
MTACPSRQEFVAVVVPSTQWHVLLCPSNLTMALAAALADRGAWTPTWKRKRRMPRSPVSKIVTEACMPGMVFVPTFEAGDLPFVPRCRFKLMRNYDRTLVRVSDRSLEPLRRIDITPLVPAHRLPKPGSRVRFVSGPFQGLRGRVLSCSIRCAEVDVEGFAQPIKAPPSLLEKIVP